MRKILCTVEERCYHPATGLELEPGEMEVTDDQAEQLQKSGFAQVSGERSGRKSRGADAPTK